MPICFRSAPIFSRLIPDLFRPTPADLQSPTARFSHPRMPENNPHKAGTDQKTRHNRIDHQQFYRSLAKLGDVVGYSARYFDGHFSYMPLERTNGLTLRRGLQFHHRPVAHLMESHHDAPYNFSRTQVKFSPNGTEIRDSIAPMYGTKCSLKNRYSRKNLCRLASVCW